MFYLNKHDDFKKTNSSNQLYQIKHMSKLILLFLFSLLLLCGCQQRTPLQYTYVSSRPYTVRGARYVPQKHYEYDQVGLASWYGVTDGFDGKPKATGETFNCMEMTAAHRTLPLPSVVKVTNLRNNKSIVVIVDDRGPYCYRGRIIDLSFMAAKKLDIHRCKPAQVRVQSMVQDTLLLAKYIAQNCKNRKDRYGRSWSQIYFQEIAKNKKGRKR